MLQRNEIGTNAHKLLWLASKPANASYEWLSAECPANQYMDEHDALESAVMDLNSLAQTAPHTFGALYERAAKVWR